MSRHASVELPPRPSGRDREAAARAAAEAWRAAVQSAEDELREAGREQEYWENRVRELSEELLAASGEHQSGAARAQLRTKLTRATLDASAERAHAVNLEEGVRRLRAACQEMQEVVRASAHEQMAVEQDERTEAAAAASAERIASGLAAAAEEKEAQLAAQDEAQRKLRRIAQEVAAHNEVLSHEVDRLSAALPSLERQKEALTSRLQAAGGSTEEVRRRLEREAQCAEELAAEAARLRQERAKVGELQAERLVLARACEGMAGEVPALKERVAALTAAVAEGAALQREKSELELELQSFDELRARKRALEKAAASLPGLEEDWQGLEGLARKAQELRAETRRLEAQAAKAPAQRALIQGLKERLAAHERCCQSIDSAAAENAARHAEAAARLREELMAKEAASRDREAERAAALGRCTSDLQTERRRLQHRLEQLQQEQERRKEAHKARLQRVADEQRRELADLRREAEVPRTLVAAADTALADARKRRQQEAFLAAARHDEERRKLESSLSAVRRQAAEHREDIAEERAALDRQLKEKRDLLAAALHREAELGTSVAGETEETERLQKMLAAEERQTARRCRGDSLVRDAEEVRGALQTLRGIGSPVRADPAAGAAAEHQVRQERAAVSPPRRSPGYWADSDSRRIHRWLGGSASPSGCSASPSPIRAAG